MAYVYKEHYDATYLMNSKDKNGLDPCFFIACSIDRGPGKSFSFSKKLFNKFLDKSEKFILLTRNIGDLGNVAEGVLRSYLSFAMSETVITEKIQMKGVFSRVFATVGTGEETETHEIGYVIPIRACDKIKLISSLFYDATCFFFDEFQPMNFSAYLPNEVDMVRNIYKSIARGNGSATRYMPIYMTSNTIQIHNPYFTALGLTKAIQSNTRFYRGDGVVFENVVVEGLAEEHASSPIDRALAGHIQEQRKSNSNLWLNDENSLVSKPEAEWGHGYYVCTLIYNKDKIGVYRYDNVDMFYCSRKVDNNCKYIYNTTLNSNLNIPMLRNSKFLQKLKDAYYNAQIRCQDGSIQNILRDIF